MSLLLSYNNKVNYYFEKTLLYISFINLLYIILFFFLHYQSVPYFDIHYQYIFHNFLNMVRLINVNLNKILNFNAVSFL